MSLQTGPDPASLLTTALEKLLYLESRLESSEAAREDARRDGERQRLAAAQARRQSSDWQRRATEAEVAAEGAEREAMLLREALQGARHALSEAPTSSELLEKLHDAETQLARFARERETWLDRMVALSRLRTEGDDALDLGSFIAELRSELMALRSGEKRTPATVSTRPAAPEAERLVAAAPAAHVDPEELVRAAKLTRTERTLALLCARDLTSDSAGLRRRAAERLAQAGVDALNPLIVQLLHSEREPSTRVAFVRLIDETGSADSAGVVLGEALGDADPRVRTAALEGLSRRGDDRLEAAFRDPSAAVRRRALALLGRTPDALDRLADALQDEEPGVRRVAALGLASRSGGEAVALLRIAARAHDPDVRRVAREALTKRGLPIEPPHLEDLPEPTVESAPPPEPIAEAPAEPVEAPVAAAPEADPEPAGDTPSTPDPLDERVLEEIRMSLRGRTMSELAVLVHEGEATLGPLIQRLTAAGQLVWRGRKLYPA